MCRWFVDDGEGQCRRHDMGTVAGSRGYIGRVKVDDMVRLVCNVVWSDVVESVDCVECVECVGVLGEKGMKMYRVRRL